MKRIVVIGGGPAGMAAAVSAKENGIEQVMILERHAYLGGVLPQCIHTGFGTQIYGEDYTGGEYAWLWKEKVKQAGIEICMDTTVLSIEKADVPGSVHRQAAGRAAEYPACGEQWVLECVNAKKGAYTLQADAIILASGCRERTLPQMMIPGSRPAGVFTAGSAQLMMNIKNYLPGRSAVIFGSGDIGLIMARRMTLEGIKVKLILGQEATGLARNIVQCVEDFDIPMRYGWTLVSTHGYRRLKGVSIAPIGEDGNPKLSEKQYIPCDTLLVATGLIPERDICRKYEPGIEPGLFVCGNANKVHDLVDHVTEEALEVGRLAAVYVKEKDKQSPSERMEKLCGGGTQLLETEKRELVGKSGNMVCTTCPKGCVMQVSRDPFTVAGNQCEKGEKFAYQELENPMRVLTTIIKIQGEQEHVVAVRTDRSIEKKDMLLVMKAAKKVCVSTGVTLGQLVAKDIAGTGANLIATWIG